MPFDECCIIFNPVSTIYIYILTFSLVKMSLVLNIRDSNNIKKSVH